VARLQTSENAHHVCMSDFDDVDRFSGRESGEPEADGPDEPDESKEEDEDDGPQPWAKTSSGDTDL